MSGVLFKNATLVLPTSIHKNGMLLMAEGRIIALGTTQTQPGLEEQMKASRVVDLGGDMLIPGLIDTHVHGTGGFDIMDGTLNSLKKLGEALLKEGTTAFLPTTMSCSQEELFAVLEKIRIEMDARVSLEKAGLGEKTERLDPLEGGAEFLGIHLEGPFLSPHFKGAQAEENIFPLEGHAMTVLTELTKRFPRLIRILTLAVERPDARDLVQHCLDHNIIPSVGHSDATYEEMQEALNWGLRHVTHAFNAMPPIHHRQPGLLTLALTHSEVIIELIADGVHIHPGVLKMALQLKPIGRVCLVSDGTRAVGMPDGNYDLGGQLTRVRQGTVRLEDGTLAGSAQPLLHGVQTLVKRVNWPLQKAVHYASLNPARLLGIDDRLGSLELGKEATFLRLTPELHLKGVWLKGKLVVENDK